MGKAPDGYQILVLAEHYGVLPDTVESDMSEYWIARTLVYLEGKAQEQKQARK